MQVLAVVLQVTLLAESRVAHGTNVRPSIAVVDALVTIDTALGTEPFPAHVARVRPLLGMDGNVLV